MCPVCETVSANGLCLVCKARYDELSDRLRELGGPDFYPEPRSLGEMGWLEVAVEKLAFSEKMRRVEARRSAKVRELWAAERIVGM